MKKYMQASIIVACTLLCLAVPAEPVRQLSWEDLVPAKLLADDPLAKLSPEQQDLVAWVVATLDNVPKRSPRTEERYKEIDAAMSTLKKAGIDLKEILAKREEIRTAIVDALNGQRVRIPGYLLPLELSGTQVIEFLLVPYVGACIHVPPPPPNQIVYVKTAPDNGYERKKIFDPVWVTGVISVKSMTKDLFLVDGSAGINIGYSMQAERVEPYKE
jgi:hypothetical protein